MSIWKSLFFITKHMRLSCATMLFVMLSFSIAEAYEITVDAAIRGTADGTFIDTGDTWVEGTPSLIPEVSINDSVSVNGYTFEYLASSNIQTGTLKVMTSAVSAPGSLGTASASGLGMPQAFAHIEEYLTFTPINSNPYQVTLSMYVDGSISMDPSTNHFNLMGLTMNEIGGPGWEQDWITLSPSNSISQSIDVSLTLQGVSTVYFIAGMESYMYGIDGDGKESVFALDNTAQLSLLMSPGVSMTSSSGLFLSATAVPEPSTMLLFGSGVLGMVLYRRMRRKT